MACVYTSDSRALAWLETVAHLNARGLPLNRYLDTVTIPDDWPVSLTISISTLESLPVLERKKRLGAGDIHPQPEMLKRTRVIRPSPC